MNVVRGCIMIPNGWCMTMEYTMDEPSRNVSAPASMVIWWNMNNQPSNAFEFLSTIRREIIWHLRLTRLSIDGAESRVQKVPLPCADLNRLAEEDLCSSTRARSRASFASVWEDVRFMGMYIIKTISCHQIRSTVSHGYPQSCLTMRLGSTAYRKVRRWRIA
jgi:hypothetical protein